MAANIGTAISAWSTTAGSNQPDSTDLASTLREDLQAIQAAVRYLRTSGTIASASTTDMATKSEEILSVSGTTTITALGTVSAGMIKVLVFEGVLTLTHNVTSLILPTAANITTAAGDVAVMLSLGAGNWRCITYQRASGYTAAGGWEKLSSQTIVTQSEVVFTGLSSTYPRYRLISNVLTFSTDAALHLLSGAGSTDSGTNYAYNYEKTVFEGASASAGDETGASQIIISAGMDATPQGHAIDIDLSYLGLRLQASWQFPYHDTAGQKSLIIGAGFYTSSGTVDRVLLKPSTGTISGTFVLYGLR